MNFVGDQANLPAFYAYDADYLYFRYRLDADPAHGGGFDQFVVDGAHAGAVRQPVPVPVPALAERQERHDRDLGEHRRPRTSTSRRSSPTTPRCSCISAAVRIARAQPPADSSFGGQADYFLDFAFPVSTLVDKGVIASAGDLAQSFFFPATSTNPNNYNKGYLNCPFQPYTALTIQKTVAPAVAPANAVTPLTYTIDVHNTTGQAVGVVIEDVRAAGVPRQRRRCR